MNLSHSVIYLLGLCLLSAKTNALNEKHPQSPYHTSDDEIFDVIPLHNAK